MGHFMKLSSFPDSASWLNALLEAWQEVGGEALHSRGEFFVALAGGSTPASFYRALGKLNWPWSATRFFIGDERWVPQDHAESNYRMIYESFYPHPIQLERWKTELPKPEEAAIDYAKRLKQTLCEPPRFDLVLLGIGNDGHTASLFPKTPGLAEREKITVSHYVDAVRASRLTITYPLIRQSRHVWFLAQGPSKKPWVEKMAGSTDKSFPAAQVECELTEPEIFFAES